MKKISLLMVALFITVFFVECKGQPKDDYEIFSNTVPTATKYIFFLEKKSANPYRLVEGMDWIQLGSDTTILKVGTASVPSFTINLDNDGSEYMVGVVAQNVAGFYGGMGTAIAIVGIVPNVPGAVGLRKKQ